MGLDLDTTTYLAGEWIIWVWYGMQNFPLFNICQWRLDCWNQEYFGVRLTKPLLYVCLCLCPHTHIRVSVSLSFACVCTSSFSGWFSVTVVLVLCCRYTPHQILQFLSQFSAEAASHVWPSLLIFFSNSLLHLCASSKCLSHSLSVNGCNLTTWPHRAHALLASRGSPALPELRFQPLPVLGRLSPSLLCSRGWILADMGKDWRTPRDEFRSSQSIPG